MSVNLNIAASLLPQPVVNGFDFSIFVRGASSAAPLYNAGTIDLALKTADRDEAKQLAQIAADPRVQADLKRYEQVVRNAETVDEVLDDPVARRVLLKANGLGEQVDNIGLAKRALVSDPNDKDSLANKLSSVNGNWLDFTKIYNLDLFGVSGLQFSSVIQQVKDGYIAETRLDNLDKQLPGLGSAILFKRIASAIDTPLKALGDPLAREVITTAFNIPQQIAIQSLEAQEKAIEEKLDLSRLQNPDYVERLAHRYLLEKNSTAGGLTA